MMEKKVSVVIPTFNRKEKLIRAINSVLNQTYQDFEIIIIDDCSKDKTFGVVKKIDDDRIIYSRNKKNLGGSASRNRGVSMAKGEYVAFLDDDDLWMPNKLEEQMSVIRNLDEKYCGAFCGFSIIKDNKESTSKIYKKEGCLFYELLDYNCIGTTSTIIIRKKCLNNVGGFNEDLPSNQDLDLFLRLAKKYKFKNIRKTLVNYYIHNDGQIFNDCYKGLKGASHIYERYKDEIIKNKKCHSRHLYRLSILYMENKNIKESVKHLKKAIKIDYLNVKYYIVLLLLFFSPKTYSLFKKILIKY